MLLVSGCSNFIGCVIGVKVYASLVIFECLALVGLATSAMWFSDNEPTSVLYVAIICIFATLGFLYFALDAILLENIFQFWASIVVHIMIAFYITSVSVYNTSIHE
jgi:hypothetical protein